MEFVSNRSNLRSHPEGERIAETLKRAVSFFHDQFHDQLVPSETEIREEDAMRVQAFLLKAFPIAADNFRTHRHLQLTGEFAAEIAKRLGYNPAEFKILGLLHDVGRLLTHPDGVNPHRYFRNDVLGDFFMKQLQIPDSLMKKLQPNSSYLYPDEFLTMDAFTPEQRIVIIADICGKRKDDSSVQSFAETMEYHYRSRSKMPTDGPWPSQNDASRIITDDIVHQWGKIYEEIVAWLQKEYSVDVASLREEIQQRGMPKELVFTA